VSGGERKGNEYSEARVSPPSLYSRLRNRKKWTEEIAWGKGSNGSRAWSGLMERTEAVPAVGAGRARAVLSCAASSTGMGAGACRASTSTRQAGPGRFRTVLSRTVLVPARFVVEPPELSGPHAPIIVSKTSDRCARVPNDSRSLSGVLGIPESSTF